MQAVRRPRGRGFVIVVGLLMALSWAAGSARAQGASAAAGSPPGVAAYQPDARFLKEGPNRKTKQVVALSGVKSDAELRVVREAMEEIITFVRLFGLTGSDMGDVVPKGMTAEEVARIKASPVANRTFQNMTTAQGRNAMPIAVASGHLAFSIDQWAVESDSALSVRVDFRQPFYEFKPV